MTELKPYAEYVSREIEWLGPIPAQWSVERLKRSTYIKARVGWKGLTSDEFEEEAYAYLVTGGDFSRKYIDWSDSYQVSQARYEDDPFIQLRNGDLLITKDGTIGKLAVVKGLDKPACLNSGIFVVRPNEMYSSEFLYWVLSSSVFQTFVDLTTYGSTIRHLYQNVFEDFAFAFPAPDEQRSIVDFLDTETAEIDAFIADQEELIGLLAERRAATISHAVTKGLDPTVPKKDSGIEWIGDIPEDWETMRIKQFVSVPVTDGPHETPELYDDGIPFVSAEAVGAGFLNMDKIRGFISEEDDLRFARKYRPMRDDLYMVKSGATTGVVAIVDTDARFNIWSPLAAIRCGESAFPPFVMYALKSMQFQESVRLHWNYGTQQNIGMSVIENLPVALPNIEQQKVIATHLDAEIDEIDAATADAAEAIELSRERRAALISAAVTGKIDVRGHGAAA